MSDIASAVAGTAADLGLVPAEADPTEGLNSEIAVAPEAQETEFNPVLPDDIEQLLDEPELDDESVQALVEEIDDPDELARELAKARKQLAFEKDQRVKASRKNWEQEAQKFFPLCDPAAIHADSRRAFLKAAKAQHQRTYALLKPRLDEIEQIKATAREQALAEERAAVAGAYGKPTVGTGTPPPSTTADDRLEMARQRRDLRGSIAAMIEAGRI